VFRLREVAVIGFVLAGKEVGGGSEFGTGCLGGAGERVGIDLAVVNDFFGNRGLMDEGRRGWGDVGGIGRCSAGRCCRRSAPANGGSATRLYALNGRFRDGVGIFAEVVFDVVVILANLVGPNGASILEVNDVGGRGQRPDNQNEKH